MEHILLPQWLIALALIWRSVILWEAYPHMPTLIRTARLYPSLGLALIYIIFMFLPGFPDIEKIAVGRIGFIILLLWDGIFLRWILRRPFLFDRKK